MAVPTKVNFDFAAADNTLADLKRDSAGITEVSQQMQSIINNDLINSEFFDEQLRSGFSQAFLGVYKECKNMSAGIDMFVNGLQQIRDSYYEEHQQWLKYSDEMSKISREAAEKQAALNKKYN